MTTGGKRQQRDRGNQGPRSEGDALESWAEGSLVTLLLRSGLVELEVHRRNVADRLNVAKLEAGDGLEEVGVGVDGLDLVHPDVCRTHTKRVSARLDPPL